MKPIYECLDYLLKHLQENRFRPEGQRKKFDVDKIVMPDLELQNHHEFKGLIDMLVEDKNAIFLDGYKDNLENYSGRTMITPQGIELLSNDGYQGLATRRLAENTRLRNLETAQKRHQYWMTWLTAILAASAIATILYYGVELYWNYGWFQYR